MAVSAHGGGVQVSYARRRRGGFQEFWAPVDLAVAAMLRGLGLGGVVPEPCFSCKFATASAQRRRLALAAAQLVSGCKTLEAVFLLWGFDVFLRDYSSLVGRLQLPDVTVQRRLVVAEFRGLLVLARRPLLSFEFK